MQRVPVTKKKIVYEERQGPVDADGRPLPEEEDDATEAPALDPNLRIVPKTYAEGATAKRDRQVYPRPQSK